MGEVYVMRAVRIVASAALAGAIMSTTAAMAQSGSASSGELSRKLVDVCIYDQYRQQGDSKGIAKRCQCAVRKAAPSLNAKEVSRLQLGAPLTGSVRTAVYQGIAACQ